MAGPIGRTRSRVSLRSAPRSNASVVIALGPQEKIEILEDQGDWLKVKLTKVRGTAAGYAPRLAIIKPDPEAPPVFPQVEVVPGGASIAGVPPSLKPGELVDWLQAGGKPTWVADDVWSQLDGVQQQALVDGVRNAIQQHQTAWDDWLAELQNNQRMDEATMEEWLTILKDGRDVWSVRPERIFKGAGENTGHLGWIGVDDILLWSGHIQRNVQEPKYKDWYHVGLTKMDRDLDGWFKADLLEAYDLPTPENDPSIAKNAENIFDLAQPKLRAPADPEIAQALARRSAAQYIDLKAVLGWNKQHFNLCGEFCVAAIFGEDIIPLLKRWKASYDKAQTILSRNRGTTLIDLQSILRLNGPEGEIFQYSSSVAPTAPRRIREMLAAGRMAITGVTISSRSGKLEPRGGVQHWVVLVDIVPVGTSGWVRLYNPFMNREEVYAYDLFLEAFRRFGIGLWVDATTGH